MTADHEPSRGGHRVPAAAVLLVVPLAVALVLTLFAWPSARLAPRDLPIGVAGPPAATRAMEQRLPDRAFDVQRYRDADAARAAIRDREIYGAFVLAPGGATVLTASAASPAVAQMLTAAAAHEQGARGAAAAPAEDVVAGGRAASALPAAVLPLIIGGILTGALCAATTTGAWRRAGLLVAGAALAGLTATAVVQGWLGVVDGDWVANAAGLSLTVLAIAAVVTGLHALFGPRGAILGAATMVFVGNPFSGVGSAPEMLPEPVGAIGRLMPPGAGGNLLRSTGFYDGAAAGGHVAVLAAWALAGLALLLVAGRRAGRAYAPASESTSGNTGPAPLARSCPPTIASVQPE